MSGHGESIHLAHPFLAGFAPARFEATTTQLRECFDAIQEKAEEVGEVPVSPALAHGVAYMGRIAVYLEEPVSTIDRLFAWDDINFQLTHNLGGLGLTEGSTQ